MEWRKRLILALIGFVLMFPWNLQQGLRAPTTAGLSDRSPASLNLPARQPVCRESLTSEPPFLVSASARPGLNYADFNSQALASAVVGYVPAASVVKLTRGGALPNPNSQKGRVFVSVQVLSTPSHGLDAIAQKSLQPVRGTIIGKKNRIEAGSEGYVSADALKPAKDYTFIVKQDSPLAQIPGAGPYLAGRALRLAIDPSGQYKVRSCCLPGQGEHECRTHYIFEVLKPDLSSSERDFAFDRDACVNELSGLRPVDNEQIAPVLNFVNMTQGSMNRGAAELELIDSTGLVRIPSDPKTGEGPFGSYHYDPNGGVGGPYDSFADATSACAFLRVLEAHQKSCQKAGCEVQWGDAYSAAIWGHHQEHDSGRCIDVHPLKRADSREPVRWNYDPKHLYDRAKTQEFVDLLLRAGAEPDHLFFNDRNIAGAKWHAEHDNHIHFCFNGDSPLVLSACENGISPARVPLANRGVPSTAQRKPSGLTTPRSP